MTFAAQETSRTDGNPVLLYEFSKTGETTLRYVQGKTDLVVGADTYVASGIKAGSPRHAARIQLEDVQVVFPASEDPDLQGEWTFTIKAMHRTDGANEVVTIWTGFTGRPTRRWTTVTYTVQNIRAKQNFIRAVNTAERKCQHTIYDPRCAVNKATFTTTGNVTNVASNVLTVTEAGAQADGYYDGGILTFDGVDYYINNHTGTSLVMKDVVPGLSAPGTADIAPGCDRTRGSGGCGRFANILNMLAAPEVRSGRVFGGGERF